MAPAKTGRFNYTTSAIDRIRQMERTSIVGFLDQVSWKGKLRAFKALPTPKGFRPGRQVTVDRQIRLLANRLTEDPTRTLKNVHRDFDSLGLAWVLWGTEHLGAGEAINDCINPSSSQQTSEPPQVADQSDGDDPRAVSLLERLQQLSHSNQCTREDIQRFLQFSPFGETEHLRRIVETCKPSSEVVRDTKLSQLPDRIETAERDIRALGKLVDTLSEKTESNTQEISSLHGQVATLHTALAQDIETTSHFSDRLGEMRTEIAANRQQSAERADRQDDLVQELAASTEKLRLDVAAIADQIGPLSNRTSEEGEAIKTISAELGQLRHVVAEVRRVVNTISTSKPAVEVDANLSAHQPTARPVLALERVPQISGTPTQPGVVDEYIEAVRTNLESLGVKRSSAEPLALECIAALLVGQIPYFSGVHGGRVAEACATALAAQDTLALTVPVGLIAPNELRQHLNSLLRGEGQHLSCLILDGINRSAFDAFGDSLVDFTSRRRSGDSSSRALVTMATVTDGPASLPISLHHLSLGHSSPPTHSTGAPASRRKGNEHVAQRQRSCGSGRATLPTTPLLMPKKP